MVVGSLVKDEVRGASVEQSKSLLRGESDFNLARPRPIAAKVRMSIGAFLQIEVVEVDDVQVLTGPVEMATGDGSIFVDKRE